MDLSNQSTKENKLVMAFIIAMVVIFGLLLFIIFRKPEPVPVIDNSKRLRDSITLLTGQIEDEKKITKHYLHIADSLKSLTPTITIIYREQKKFASTASIDQLDSIIRANSGLKPRIKRY
jgi:hypothetical protein